MEIETNTDENTQQQVKDQGTVVENSGGSNEVAPELLADIPDVDQNEAEMLNYYQEAVTQNKLGNIDGEVSAVQSALNDEDIDGIVKELSNSALATTEEFNRAIGGRKDANGIEIIAKKMKEADENGETQSVKRELLRKINKAKSDVQARIDAVKVHVGGNKDRVGKEINDAIAAVTNDHGKIYGKALQADIDEGARKVMEKFGTITAKQYSKVVENAKARIVHEAKAGAKAGAQEDKGGQPKNAGEGLPKVTQKTPMGEEAAVEQPTIRIKPQEMQRHTADGMTDVASIIKERHHNNYYGDSDNGIGNIEWQ